MKYGFVLPSGDARTAADMARAAEEAGWDAFFVWEPVWGVDAWVCLAAAAVVTPVSYTHLRAHETVLDLVCRLLLEKKQKNTKKKNLVQSCK